MQQYELFLPIHVLYPQNVNLPFSSGTKYHCFYVDLLYQNSITVVLLLLSRILFVSTELCFHIDNAILITSRCIRIHPPWSSSLKGIANYLAPVVLH